MQARVRHLQRLCLGIYGGLLDQHVPSLPALLERAAEALRLLTMGKFITCLKARRALP